MRVAVILALLLLSPVSPRADAATDSDQVLTTMARWGLCVVDQVGEDEAKSLMYAAVTKIDAKFLRQYGRKATDFAEDAYGANFVQHYYMAAKAQHERLGNPAAVCRDLSMRVIALSQ